VRRVLAIVLALWQPLAFASIAGPSWSSLGFRGALAALELLVAACVAALSMAAAWALWTDAPAAVPLARAALLSGVARSVHALHWSRLPSDVPPGSAPVYAAIIVGHAAFWLWYLSRTVAEGDGARPAVPGEERGSAATEPRERSAPAKRRARERVGGTGGVKPPG
jgi:hypothetical protein